MLAACQSKRDSMEVGSRGYRIPAVHQEAQGPLDFGPTRADEELLAEIRRRFVSAEPFHGSNDPLAAVFHRSSLPQRFAGVAVVVYQPGQRRIVVVRQKRGWAGVAATLDRVRHHPRHGEVDFGDSSKSRIQLDFIARPPVRVDLDDLEEGESGVDRFEPGVDGFRLSHDDEVRYFLPGDAFVRSVQTEGQLFSYLKRLTSADDLDDIKARRFVSRSYISYQDSWLRLYRGIPVRGALDRAQVEHATDQAIEHVLRNMHADGRFRYFYDSAKDTFRDRKHPKRDPEKDPYYNILRHSGGGLLLLFDYQHRKDPHLLRAVRKAIDFLLAQVRAYESPDGRSGGYVFYNRKAKLGGSAIGLALLSEYQRLSGDETYRDSAERLKNHLLNEISDTGEFRYYRVFLDEEVSWEENQDYFGFYYPGEAILGLADYYNYLAAESEKQEIRTKLQKALHFLFEVRPIVHRQHYSALPSDSWLMMGVNEAWNAPELRDPKYAKFVFEDADKMVERMYTHADALYPDYPGSFYYEYGDYPYADGARAEGLLAALQLARKMGDEARTKKYAAAAGQVVWATLHLTNTAEAMYFADRPDLAIGGIRFKHTRQWFRIDTTQHVAGFYLKLLPSWRLLPD